MTQAGTSNHIFQHLLLEDVGMLVGYWSDTEERGKWDLFGNQAGKQNPRKYGRGSR